MQNAVMDIMPSTYYRLILREWGTSPQMRALISRGIDADAPSQISIEQQLNQVSVLGAQLSPGWGLRLGALFDPPAHGPVGVAVQSAPNVAESVSVIARYGHLRTPFLRYVTWRSPQELKITFQYSDRTSPDVIDPINDATLVGIQNLLRPVMGGSFNEVVFELAKERSSYATLYKSYLHGQVVFDANETAIVLPTKFLEKPSPLSDVELHRSSVETLLKLSRGIEVGDPIANVTAQLIAANTSAPLRVEDVARTLHISKRTLVRRLAKAGTSFSELADAHRRARAHAMLCDPGVNLASIAAELGYADPANFGRACRRWYGKSPGQYRRHILHQHR